MKRRRSWPGIISETLSETIPLSLPDCDACNVGLSSRFLDQRMAFNSAGLKYRCAGVAVVAGLVVLYCFDRRCAGDRPGRARGPRDNAAQRRVAAKPCEQTW